MPDRTPRVASALLGVLTLVLASACSRIPEGRSAIDEVTVVGAKQLEASAITDRLATEASPEFLGIFRGLFFDYAIYDRAALHRDLERVEHYYRARGYYDVRVRAGRVIPTSKRHVRVEVVVEEGRPVINHDLVIDGTGHLPPSIAAAVVLAVQKKLRKGEPFDEDKFKAAEAAARRALTDNGYAYAKVDRDVFLDIVQRIADARFTVTPGEPARFGKVTIVGLDPDGKEGPRPQELSEAPLLRAINIAEGEPYSTAAIDRATQALLDLGIFSVVQIVPDLPNPPPASHVVPITAKVEPSRLRQVRLGGGFEFDQIKTDVHALVGWENHNLFGGLRDFTVDFKPGTVLYPTRLGNNIALPNRLLPEERLKFQLKQPGFLEARTEGFVRPEFNVYPLLVQANPLPGAPVIGYAEFKGSVGVDRTLWKFFVSLSYNAQVEDPFSYVNPIDPALKGNVLVLSYPDLLVQFDLRDDKVKPHKGIFLGNDVQVAGFGGTASDVKIQPEARTYVPLGRRVTFATRGTLGWLFPVNYGSFVKGNPADPNGINNLTRSVVTDIETMYFRGFFSGGTSSNRGYPIRGIAPYGYVPFLNPATASSQVQNSCDPTSLMNDHATVANPGSSTPQNVALAKSALQNCLSPIGGFTLWELSNEFRINVSGPFSVSTFCDMSDVGNQPGQFRKGYLHLSCGLGGRYDTPVGPIRLDIAYRFPGLQELGVPDEIHLVNSPSSPISYPPRLFSQPFALAFGIGEAF
jgi:outer membrane protein assembly factor BamA